MAEFSKFLSGGAPFLFETEFWLLVLFSLVLPVAGYTLLMIKRAVSSHTVLAFGLLFLFIAGVDVVLLQHLASLAAQTPSLVGDAVFHSEVSVALYLLPALFAGIGINMISHVLMRHLSEAEGRFETERQTRKARQAEKS